MFTLQDGIKYIGIAAIVYFLLKAFAHNKLTNTQTIILVVCIMALVIFVACQNFNCPKKIIPEGFESNNLMVANSTNINMEDGAFNETIEHTDDDINDFKNIVGIDNKRYNVIKTNEKNKIDQIRNSYKNDMVYTTTHPFNTVPLGSQLYGYTYLPPENWFRAYERPPICITDKKSTVGPVADPSIAGLLEFDTNPENYTLGSMSLDHRYIKNVLNKNVT
jgi:hypothetical protein